MHTHLASHQPKSNSVARLVEPDDNDIPQGWLRTLRIGVRRYGLLGALGRYLMIRDELRKFIKRGGSKSDRSFRRELLDRFILIQRKIPCAHSPWQFVTVARYILDLEVDGPIVECGCFKGGSTAKLSLLAERTNRTLYVCDSFQGLPYPASEDELVLKGNEGCPAYFLSIGDYRGTIEEVRENVRSYGCLEACRFVPGLFRDTLARLDIAPAVVFIDVDFVSSARDCLRYLWPRTVRNGYWFTHEAIFSGYISGILDARWWHATFGECPPVIIGAGCGLSVASPGIAYFQKLT